MPFDRSKEEEAPETPLTLQKVTTRERNCLQSGGCKNKVLLTGNACMHVKAES